MKQVYCCLTLFSVGVLAVAQQAHIDDIRDATGKRAGHATLKSASTNSSNLIGKSAYMFTATSDKGQKISLKALLKKPTTLMFIEKGCPCCEGATPYFDRIGAKYADISNVVGVVAGTELEAASWKKRTRAQFLVVADPGAKIPKEFGAQAGLATRLVDCSGKIVLSYPGYSAPMLKELTNKLAVLAGVAERKFDTRPAPQAMTSGCAIYGGAR